MNSFDVDKRDFCKGAMAAISKHERVNALEVHKIVIRELAAVRQNQSVNSLKVNKTCARVGLV